MHAPGAEDRRSGRHPTDRCGRREGRRGGDARLKHGGGDGCRGELSLVRHRAGHLPEDLRLRRRLADCLLDDRSELLDDEDLLVPVDEGRQPLLVDGVGPDYCERDVVGDHFPDVGGRDAARDDGDPAPDGVAVVAEFDEPLFERLLLLVQFLVEHPCVRGDDHVLPGIAAKDSGPVSGADLSDLDVTL